MAVCSRAARSSACPGSNSKNQVGWLQKKKKNKVEQYVTNYLLIAAFDVWVIANELCAAVSSQRKHVGEVQIDTLQAFGIQH